MKKFGESEKLQMKSKSIKIEWKLNLEIHKQPMKISERMLKQSLKIYLMKYQSIIVI